MKELQNNCGAENSSFIRIITQITSMVIFILYSSIALAQSETELQKIVSSDRASFDFFGYSVEIDGDYAIISAYNEDEDTEGENTMVNAGSAYIFKREADGTWQQEAKLVASDRASGDYFGSSVALDGSYAIVGAEQDDEDVDGGTISGAAYIFERSADGTWSETAKLVASERASSDFFGFSVSISGDQAVVGAFAEDEDANEQNTIDNAGSVYVFQRDNNGTWSKTAKLVASDRAEYDYFGVSVAIDGGHIIVSANREDEDMNGDNTLDEAGAAYIFEQASDGSWNEVAKLVTNDRGKDDFFGTSVSISEGKAVVGALNEDEDADGENRISKAGSAYVFQRASNGTWTQTAKLVASDRGFSEFFGRSVSISDDHIVIGASEDENGDDDINSGAAYVFKRATDGTWTEEMKLVASDRASEDEFGLAVAIDGKNIIIGANREDEDENNENAASAAGSAYVFVLPEIVAATNEALPSNSMKVYAEVNELRIWGIEISDEPITIYSLDGSEVYKSQKLNTSEPIIIEDIQLQAGNLYILEAGKNAIKFIVTAK